MPTGTWPGGQSSGRAGPSRPQYWTYICVSSSWPGGHALCWAAAAASAAAARAANSCSPASVPARRPRRRPRWRPSDRPLACARRNATRSACRSASCRACCRSWSASCAVGAYSIVQADTHRHRRRGKAATAPTAAPILPLATTACAALLRGAFHGASVRAHGAARRDASTEADVDRPYGGCGYGGGRSGIRARPRERRGSRRGPCGGTPGQARLRGAEEGSRRGHRAGLESRTTAGVPVRHTRRARDRTIAAGASDVAPEPISRSCGNLVETGAGSYNVRSVDVICDIALQVARQWEMECASNSGGDCTVLAGFYCDYTQTGYELGTISCTSGEQPGDVRNRRLRNRLRGRRSSAQRLLERPSRSSLRCRYPGWAGMRIA